MAGLAVYAVLFAGWSSNNKYRCSAACAPSTNTELWGVPGAVVMGIGATGSFNMRDIVEAQSMSGSSFRSFWFRDLRLCGVASPIAIHLTNRKPNRNWQMVISHRIFRYEMGSVLRRWIHRDRTDLALLVTLFFGGWHGPWLLPSSLVCPENWILHDVIYFVGEHRYHALVMTR